MACTRSLAAALLSTTALVVVTPSLAQTLPRGASVASGKASLTQAGATLTITQTTQSAIVNYKAFSIGQGYTVDFIQPNSQAAILNRVTGATPSTIAGQLNANGQVYLINPNGVAITKSGVVAIGGGFVASTLGMTDAEFNGARRRFSGSGASAAVSNQGAITIGRGGYAALLGGAVENSGLISVPLGEIGLGSGEAATLDVSGDGFLQVAIPTRAHVGGALIKSSGVVKAAGGSIVITAATARNAARNAINLSGYVEARSISGHNGAIQIGGGAGGAVTISGKVVARSRRGSGGAITVTGRKIALKHATIDASGKTGGGAIKIGGDLHGAGTLRRAQSVSIDAASTIKADAVSTGAGGSVVVWSNLLTTFAGQISAKGGAVSGEGGSAEVSSAGVLDYTGFANLTAAAGKTGDLLLDPYSLTISNSADANSSGFAAIGEGSVINVTTLESALTGASVTVTTGGAGSAGSDAGDITVAAPLSWSANTLTLQAYHSIFIDANLTASGTGGLALVTNNGGAGGDFSFASGASASFTGAAGAQTLAINGQAYTLLYSLANFGSTGPDSGTGDVAGIDSNAATGMDSGHYALAGDLTDAGVTFAAPLLGSGGNTFAGVLEGLGHTISSLTINDSSDSTVGLVGISSGAVRDIGLIGGSVNLSGAGFAGGLVGDNVRGTITQAYATDAVSGGSFAGGLVGYNNSGAITQAYATGAVSGGAGVAGVGGLVGYNSSGAITQAYATGAVNAGAGVAAGGGLVGYNDGGAITQAYATGAVGGGTSRLVGGLVGINTGTISNSFYDASTTGQSNGIGDDLANQTVTGLTTAQLQTGGLAALGFSASAWGGAAGGLYPYLTRFFPNGVQAVSGFAYRDAGVAAAASGANGAVTVSLDAGGGLAGQATTGANGYYYIALANGALTNGEGLLVSTAANSGTGAANAATLATSAGATAQSGVALYGNALTLVTSATLLSQAPSLAAAQASATTVAGADGAAGSVVAATTGRGLIATGASFTIDQSVTTANTLILATQSGDPLTVASSLTLDGGAGLDLLSGGTLAINAPILVEGAGAAALSYDTSAATNFSFGNGASLTFANADGSAAGAPVVGQTLAINGQAYTLLYSLANVGSTGPDSGTGDLAGIDSNAAAGMDSGHYALAGDLTDAGVTFAAPLLGSGGNTFAGVLEGLGHTISNLTINDSSDSTVGLVGISSGAVRDIGLIGGSVNLSGAGFAGGLVGDNVRGTITQAYATDAVSGGSFAGGLVGYNNSGAITQAYATGAVSGGAGVAGVGGLVGYNSSGAITQAYATGAVNAGAGVAAGGGLVGYNDGGAITQAYATGAVGGGTSRLVGGLVGINTGTIANSFYDASTTGQSNGIGDDLANQTVTGLTTAQLQTGGLAALGFSASAWGGAAGGLYPYLTRFFPNGVQAVSGFAYRDAGVAAAASGANGAVTVSLDAGGGLAGQATTGANGYYYIALANGALTNGEGLLVSTAANSGTGAANAATLATSAGATAQSGVALYGNALTLVTSATLLSQAPSLATAQASATTVAGADGAAGSVVAATTGRGLIATGASFTIDQSVTTANTLILATQSGDPLTVASSLTLDGGAGLDLLSGGTLAINAPILVEGAGAAALSYDTSAATNFSFGNGASLTFANADGSAAGAPVVGQTLAINGQAYTLLYTLANFGSTGPDSGTGDLAGIDSNAAAGMDSGHYALAGDLTDAGVTFAAPLLGSGGNTFAGVLEGLGHTISNLTINDSSDSTVGLVGESSGAVRDIGLIGGSINLSGAGFAGGLVGDNNGGTITQAYATDAVSGAGFAGGLVGYNSSGAITQAYATGAVSGSVGVGGLIGENIGGAITQAYATGAVNAAAGVVAGGGLVGDNDGGAITQAYATGAVGGGTSRLVGGLVGINTGTISNSFYDASTTGQSNGIGNDLANQTVTGLTTAQLQTGGLPLGFSASAWGGAAGGLYPYLTRFFPNGVQAVSGFAYRDAGVAAAASGANGAVTVSLDAGGGLAGQATTGANGYYYIALANGALTNGEGLLVSTAANSGTGAANAATLATSAGATAQSGVALYGNALTLVTSATLLSQAPSLATAQASATTVAGADGAAGSVVAATTGRGLIATGASFTIDQSVTTANTLILATQSGDPLTVASSLTLDGGAGLDLLSGGTLAINAPILVEGAGAAALSYDTSAATNFSFGNGASLTFANADGSAAGAPVVGQTLAINGQAYTLLYTLANVGSTGPDSGTGDVAGIDSNAAAGMDSGHYALAGDLTDAGVTFAAPLLGSGGNTFAGVLEGLGHTISSLTINDGGDSNVGLVGESSGAVRDIGLIGGSVSSGSDFSDVGSLVGNNNGAITEAYATSAVNGAYGSNAGGLVGGSGGAGAITQAYATGAVNAVDDSNAGGLVGYNGGAIIEAYATGAVRSGLGSWVGGLVGFNDAPGVITETYATGAVSSGAGSTVSGLVGVDFSTFTSGGYYDASTTGQSNGIGNDLANQTVTGLTTAQLQTGGLPLGFSASAWGGAAGGLYPYLTRFFPNGVQAVSGFAYRDAGVAAAASGANGAVTVSLDAGGGLAGQATTGANGYYYIALANGALTNGESLLVSTAANSGTGAANAATLATSAGATAQSGVALYGNALTLVTSATLLSQAPSLATAQASATTVAGADGAAGSVVAATTGRGLIATGASFTIDQSVTTANTLILATQSGDPLTVASSLTLDGGAGLDLLSGGTLAINAPILVEGAGAAALSYDTSAATNFSFGNGASLTFANADGSAAGAPVVGQTLAINGQAYTLLYTLANVGSTGPDSGTGDVAGIDSNAAAGMDSGHYALAGDLTDAGVTFAAPLLGSGGNTFAGVLEGLGHTISSLTINDGGDSNVGLVGESSGAVRDIGLIGGSVSSGSDFSDVGSLVGNNNGAITEAYATSAVNGAYGSNAGGLVGGSGGAGAITQAYATGAVNAVDDSNAGGLVGYNGGAIIEAYATGAVRSGLGSWVGGLVGFNDAPGVITETYATGAVSSGAGSTVSGLVGVDFSTFTSGGYYDASTTGQSNGIGNDLANQTVTGLTTAQLQTGGLPLGFSASAWGGAAGGLYPYLTRFFPNGVQAVSGTAYTDRGVTILASGVSGAGLVTVAIGGQTQTVTTGVNGYYYAVFADGAISPSGAPVLAYTQANPGVGAQDAATLTTKATGSLAGFNVDGGWLMETADSSVASLSALDAAYATAAGSSAAASLAPTNRQINAAATTFIVDTSASVSGDFSLSSAGAITLGSGTMLTGANVTLAAPGAFINNSGSGAISASGRWLVYSADPAADVFGGLDSNNSAVWDTAADATVQASGDRYVFAFQPTLTLSTINDAKSYGDAATLAQDYTISGLQAAVAGAYLADAASTVYSGAPTVTSTGAAATAGIQMGGYAIAVSQGALTIGDGYTLAFANTGVLTVDPRPLTVTANGESSVYGDALPALAYTIGGAGLVNGDTLAGALATSASTGSGVGAYAITQGSLANTNYSISYVGANLSITARPLTVTATAESSVYGDALPTLTYTISGAGLVNGDALAGALTTSATNASGVGAYAITRGSLANANYSISYVGANLSITARPLTVTATAESSVYGDALPTLTYTISGAGLVNGDALAGALTTSATNASGVGAYAITRGSLANANYSISYAGANLSITARPLTVTANGESSVYGDALPALTYTIGGAGLVNGDALAGALTTSATNASGVGAYAITQGSLANTNYSISYAGAVLTITAAAPPVFAFSITPIPGDQAPPWTPILLSDDGDQTPAMIVNNLSSPQFSQPYVCVDGWCFPIPAK